MQSYVWIVPLMPLIGAVINLLLGRRLGNRVVGPLACLTVFISFCASTLLFLSLTKLPAESRSFTNLVYTWVLVGDFRAEVSFLVDPLSAVMILIVSGVGFLIHVYSIGYMHGDKNYSRYFGYLNLFVFAMLTLVLGDNLLLMFIGWEGVGLCSYLLIGFWFEDKKNAIAGMKAFIVNRVGDFGFMLGFLLLFWSLGKAGVWTIRFTELSANAHLLSAGMVTAITLLLFMGATGKSAQLPLYVWLPDAMAGPTPVSALIHAATMVTAGIYMIARMNFLYVLAPSAMTVVAVIGAATAFYAATIGLVQNDIKRVLAYSTISQLGYMFLGVGVGAYSAGIFHLMTHAFFKALLFMGAGSVMHGLSGELDLRNMGGLKEKMPRTYWTFLIATLAICGVPGLSGFFSKDEILWKAFSSDHGHWGLWLVGVLGAGLTAFYMFRVVFLAFFGESRTDKKAHESPGVMTIPLMILAALALVGGYVGVPEVLGGHNRFHHFLTPVFDRHTEVATHAHHSVGLELGLMVISVVVALAGIFIAYQMYIRHPEHPKALAERFPRLYNLLLNKYYVDEIYHAVFVRSLLGLNNLLARFDLGIIDGAVNGSAWLTKITAKWSGWWDNTFVDGAVNTTASAVISGGSVLRKTQTGRIQNYLLIAIIVIVVIMVVKII
ncbi:MAG: NADH-quinone oxidoreductase subunit L [Deltaproteobacteria bacterium]|nr:MAG: NADH-quinone oxidoreductase subunit L [Deltaproteobacteria bacterium]